MVNETFSLMESFISWENEYLNAMKIVVQKLSV